jgi:hypothetical protein
MNAVATREDQHLIPAGDAPMVAMIERIAMDPNIPIDRLEKMLAMKERMEDRAREDQDRQAKKAYFAAMSVCQSAIPVVIKKQRNTHTNSNYADLAAIEQHAMPIIHQHGFAVSFQPDGYNDKGELRILWEISHSEGHVRNGVGEIPVDGAGAQGKVNKTGTQAFGSTATYGRRYLLCMLFNISTGDDKDGNKPKDTSGPINEAQEAIIREMIDTNGPRIDKFCGKWGIEVVRDLPASKFDAAVASLTLFAREKTKRESEENKIA